MNLPPTAETANFSLEKQISDLADADLSEVFKQLPPYDRLIASEVFRRWLELSRKAWLDLKHLDLTAIPRQNITCIIKQCPSLRFVFALGRSFDLNDLACLTESRQPSVVKLYNCILTIEDDRLVDAFAKTFGENVQQASWNELVIHNARFEERTGAADSNYLPRFVFSAESLPASLTRMQLSGLRVTKISRVSTRLLLNALDRFQNLECLILHSTPDVVDGLNEVVKFAFEDNRHLLEKISALKLLKELCVSPGMYCSRQGNIGRLIASLPKLEVLFLNGIDYHHAVVQNDLGQLITTNSVLRILVLSGGVQHPNGNAEPVDLPARKRFPRGFGSDPLPLLHLFVGKAASEKLRFSLSASDAAIIYPINEPMPQYRADL